MDEPERSRDELGKKKCLPEGKTINILEKEKKKKKKGLQTISADRHLFS